MPRRRPVIPPLSRPVTHRLRAVAITAFSLQFVGLDLSARGLATRPRGTMLVLAASSASMALLAAIASSRAKRVALALVAGAFFFVQLVAIELYRPLDSEVTIAARRAWEGAGPVLREAAPMLLLGALVAAALELVLLELGSRVAARVDRRKLALVALVGFALAPGIHAMTPEVQAASAIAALGESSARGSVNGGPALPMVESSRSSFPSVLLVFDESIRAIDYPSAYSTDPAIAVKVNALFPDRIALPNHRSLASSTAISIQTVATSRTQGGSKQEIADQPTFFDVLQATRRRGDRVKVSFYTNQGKHVFERANIDASCDHFQSVADLPDPDGPDDLRDHQLLDAFERDLEAIPAASFTMVQLFATHAPYYFDQASAARRPFARSPSWENLDEVHNAYLDAIIEQDRLLEHALRAFVESRHGAPWIVVFTSDHGEAFGEHHAIHHGQNLYDEQIHVPAFVATSTGALPPEAEAQLRVRAAGPTSHVDLMPTILDMFGVWDSPAIETVRRNTVGSSLLRAAPSEPRALPITSCSASWGCPIPTWGMLGDSRALVAEVWDSRWNCVDLDDRATAAPSDDEECVRLKEASKAYFELLPNGEKNE